MNGSSSLLIFVFPAFFAVKISDRHPGNGRVVFIIGASRWNSRQSLSPIMGSRDPPAWRPWSLAVQFPLPKFASIPVIPVSVFVFVIGAGLAVYSAPGFRLSVLAIQSRADECLRGVDGRAVFFHPAGRTGSMADGKAQSLRTATQAAELPSLEFGGSPPTKNGGQPGLPAVAFKNPSDVSCGSLPPRVPRGPVRSFPLPRWDAGRGAS